MEKGEPLSVLLIDIDHFKSFNDNFGHGVGDQVLRLMANVLRERVREYDLPARYGGGEMIAGLPGAHPPPRAAAAARVRRPRPGGFLTPRSAGGPPARTTASLTLRQFLLAAAL